MYNDYYLSSIDNKLNVLTDISTNQETIIQNQETIIQNQEILGSLISHGFMWVMLCLFILMFYNMFHTMFNNHK